MLNTLELSSAKYPVLLKKLHNAPPLRYSGDFSSLENKFCLAVIGTRKPTDYGRAVVLSVIPAFVKAGVTIVSGLAPGIDILSHEIAMLAGGKTIGVLGFGFDFLHSSYCRETAKKITNTRSGLVCSPFNDSEKPASWTFIERNKIIAGLSHALLVVEAPLKSGTSYTVNAMLDLGREVYAVPGSIFSNNSKGTNMLIKSGANMLLSPSEIIDYFDKLKSSTVSSSL